VTAYVIDASAAIELAEAGYVPPAGDTLSAPTLLRSEVLAALHRDVAAGARHEHAARALIAAVDRLPVRLLGDRVLRKTAWRLAGELGWPDTFAAEYVALTVLHGDALVTDVPGRYPDAPVALCTGADLLRS
jgi:predicted nucleic acid-binding protein